MRSPRSCQSADAPPTRTFSILRAALAGVLCFATSLTALRGQNVTPGTNLLGDVGGFEKLAGTDDNLWDGVNSDGTLAVPPFSADVVTERSAFARLAMPPSVAFADLNGDGKPDLLVAGPTGYFFYYQNRGTATQPRFTNAEVLPLFLSTTIRPKESHLQRRAWDHERSCPRISLAPWRGNGVLDLLVGNYLGELLFIPNSGTAQHAAFRQPATIESVRVPTDNNGRLWGNLLSPVACDWSGNGKLDVLLGEGTYSANAIRLLQNTGGGAPQFPKEKQSFLAFGDGREQLIPAVMDYNGDGKLDLLVSDRTREIGVYLNTGGQKPSGELERTSTISFAGNGKLPGFAAPCVADFNGDGLLDLILGLDNGHIAVALNTGTKERPVFGAVQDLKGEDRLGRNIKRPDGWELWTWAEFGNALSYFTVVDAKDDPTSAPPEGTHCLKAGYWPAANDIFPVGPEGIPGSLRHFSFVRKHLTLDVGKNYAFTFKVKNSGMEKMRYSFNSLFDGYLGAVKQEVDDRNRNHRVGQRVTEYVDIGANFTGSGNWSTVTKTLNVRYKNPDLQSFKQITGDLQIEFSSNNTSDVIYFDDFQLIDPKSH